MRKIFLAGFIFCAIILPANAADVRTRPSGTLSSSADWEVSGSVLTASTSSRAAYVPLRRHPTGAKWDEGCVRKILLDTDAGTVDWQSESSLPRDVLRPIFENGSAVAGSAVSMTDFDASAAEACDLDEDSWASAVEMMNSRAMGAPYPASMALANGVLYTLCDDGVLCAINSSSGGERWNFLTPSACARLKDALEAGRNSLPWMCAGGLTAEDANGKTHLWGTLGEAGRGLFCVDVSTSVPSLVWAVEDSSSSRGLGLTGAVPLVVSLNGKLSVITPSGADASGAMLIFDALTGDLSSTARALDGKELILSPVGLTESGSLSAVVCCDGSGGVQYFTREGSALAANFRVDFEDIAGLSGLEFSFSPLACSTTRGAWLAFVAEASEGVLVAAAPASNKSVRWTATPWRGSGYGWWMLCEGFSRPFSALVYDGLLYLLGWEDGHMELKVIDLTPGRLVASTSVSSSTAALTVSDGQVVLLGADGSLTPVSELSEDIANFKTGILYTLIH